ncbi:MAG: cytidylate kinase [Fimbriimonadales bacterium]
MKRDGLVIAIDGPSGAGKSTVAKALAERIGLRYLDTGAMYRALALEAVKAKIADAPPEQLGDLAASLQVCFEGPPAAQRVICNGRDVTEEIRTPEIGDLASALSVHSAVRRAMVAAQRRIIASGGWTLEGRDTTTVVAPDADLKVYLDASPEVRARRRYEELAARGIETTLAEVLEQQMERDHRDSTREDSPLRRAQDAVLIDSSDLSVEQVVDRIIALLEE